MLFRKELLDGIRDGKVTLAFRRWLRPSVREGGSLLTPIGQLSIKSVTSVDVSDISVADAHHAGYQSREKLLEELQRQPKGELYRIELGSLRADPRIALREKRVIAESEFQGLRIRLSRLDERASGGAWTLPSLEVISNHPGVRAGDLCELVGQQKEQFKLNVRKLKNLGLTESLGTGYRLSPRGEDMLSFLRTKA